MYFPHFVARPHHAPLAARPFTRETQDQTESTAVAGQTVRQPANRVARLHNEMINVPMLPSNSHRPSRSGLRAFSNMVESSKYALGATDTTVATPIPLATLNSKAPALDCEAHISVAKTVLLNYGHPIPIRKTLGLPMVYHTPHKRTGRKHHGNCHCGGGRLKPS